MWSGRGTDWEGGGGQSALRHSILGPVGGCLFGLERPSSSTKNLIFYKRVDLRHNFLTETRTRDRIWYDRTVKCRGESGGGRVKGFLASTEPFILVGGASPSKGRTIRSPVVPM